MFDFRLPNLTGSTPQEQMAQMQSYMRYFVEQLQWALNNIESAMASVAEKEVQSEPKSTPAFPYNAVASFAALKPLIITSTEIINAYYSKISTRLLKESIDSLKVGAILEATEETPIDLDEIITPGCYYSPTAENSRYILNSPTIDNGFGLEVRELQSEDHIKQTLYYEGVTLIRYWNAVEWSEWRCCLMTEYPNSAATDFVTEAGLWHADENDPDLGYWRYKKWKSGAVDMNGLFKVTPTTYGILGTANEYYSQVIYINLPFSCEGIQFTASSTDHHILVGNTNSVESNDKQIQFRLYRFAPFDVINSDVYIQIIASGKLKTQQEE